MSTDRLAALSPAEKRAMLAQLLKREKTEAAASPAALSYNQQSMLALYARSPESVAYNTAYCVSIAGQLQPDALKRTLDSVVQRHVILRTTYEVHPGGVRQNIQPRAECDFQHEILAGEALQQELDRHIHEPFDLYRGPVLRARLFSLATDRHVLLIAVHHIAFDYWSATVLMDELRVLYAAFAAERDAALPELPAQYFDFAAWQQSLLAGPRGEAMWRFWQTRLAGDIPVLQLPTDRPRPDIQTYDGDAHTFRVAPDLVQRLETLARSRGKTLYNVFLAAFAVMMHRYSGQDDFIVGIPTAGRSSVRFEPLIGYFVNPVPLRFDCAGNPSFETFLDRCANESREAIVHADLPFAYLVERLGIPRDPSRSPLFDVMFGWDKPHKKAASDEGVTTFTLGDATQLGGPHDLVFVAFDTPGNLSIRIQYRSDLFLSETIRRMEGHFLALLENIANDTATPIRQLTILPPAERHKILVEWNATARTYPRESSVQQLFEEQVRATPDAVALSSLNGTTSYAELNAQANRLAHWLIREGTSPGSAVGVCMDRSEDLVVALLAILKAGAVYAPIDPSYPRDRQAFMLEEMNPPVLLAHSGPAAGLPFSGKILWMDQDRGVTDQESDANPSVSVAATDMAYIMYTSGSTGKPKGVCVTHRGIVRLVRSTNYIQPQPDDVFMLFAPVSFDASTFEIWGSLLNGCRLFICPPGMPSIEQISTMVEEAGVTILWATTGLFNVLAQHGAGGFGSLRQIFTGGEAASPVYVARALAAFPGVRIVNAYGPTENTTFTTSADIPANYDGYPLPVGRPIANTTVYILDADRQPVPLGVPGELYAGGDGVAAGYLDRPDLTEQSFVPDPFSADPAARMYKTGDMVRYLPNGDIEFIGRIDNQIKLRGFRIELGEIEAALRNHETVADAVVVVRTAADAQPVLVAYVTPALPAEPSAEVLRSYLEAYLPSFMIPSAFVVMETFPLLPLGKVDRRALPAPDLRTNSSTPADAPASDLERTVAAIWQETLKSGTVGLHDNFFDLGGQSLLLMQVHAKLREVLGRDIPMVQLFRCPTVASLAKALSMDGTPDEISEAQLKDRVSRQTAAQRRLAARKLTREANA